jgi:hypothetical protein
MDTGTTNLCLESVFLRPRFNFESVPRGEGIKYRSYVGGPPAMVIWMGGARAP